MLRKRMSYLVLGSLLSITSVFAAEEQNKKNDQKVNLNYELKVGVTPFKRYGSETYSERFNKGLDFGMEVYKPGEKYTLGFGGEVKRELDSEYIIGPTDRLYTYYLLGKRRIGNYYSLVGRLGRTSQAEFDSDFYGALGIEKSIGRLNIQVLGETTRLKNKFNDKRYSTVGVKLGYVFGDLYEPNIKVEEPQEVQERITVEPVIKPLVIQGDELTGGYEAYVTEVPEAQKENIKAMVNEINEYDKPGVLELKAYSDNTGTKEVNVKLANERMDNLEKEFKANNIIEKVKIEKVDPETTVKENYKLENDTFENRKANRRIEVTFIEEE